MERAVIVGMRMEIRLAIAIGLSMAVLLTGSYFPGGGGGGSAPGPQGAAGPQGPPGPSGVQGVSGSIADVATSGFGLNVAGNSLSIEDAIVPTYQINAGPPSGSCTAGTIYFDSTAKKLYFCDGDWHAVTAVTQ